MINAPELYLLPEALSRARMRHGASRLGWHHEWRREGPRPARQVAIAALHRHQI